MSIGTQQNLCFTTIIKQSNALNQKETQRLTTIVKTIFKTKKMI